MCVYTAPLSTSKMSIYYSNEIQGSAKIAGRHVEESETTPIAPSPFVYTQRESILLQSVDVYIGVCLFDHGFN